MKYYIYDYWRGPEYPTTYGATVESFNAHSEPICYIEIPNLHDWLLKMGGAVKLSPPSDNESCWTIWYSYDGRFGQR